MKPKTMLIVAAVLTFMGLGVYRGIVEGIAPSMPTCSKYSLICLR